MTIIRERISNVFHNFLQFIITFAQAIILVPILLEYWGNEKYGLWLTIQAVYVLFVTFDIGHQNFMGNELLLEYNQDIKIFKQKLSSSIIIALLLGASQLVVALILLSTGILNYSIGSSTENHIALLSLIASWFLVGSLGGILVKVYVPIGKYNRGIWWGMASKTIQLVTLIAVASFKGSVAAACISIAVILIIFNLVNFYDLKRYTKEFYPWWKGSSFKVGIKNFIKSLYLTGSLIANQFANSGLVIVISNLFTLSLVPVFTSIRTIPNSVVQVTNLILQPLQQDIVRLHSRKEYEKLIQLFKINWIVNGLFVNLGLLIVNPFIVNIFTIWTRNKLGFDLSLYVFLSISVIFISFGSNYVYYINSLNKVNIYFVSIISKLIILFSIGLLLSKSMGIAAFGVSTALGELFGSVIIPFIFMKKYFSSALKKESIYNGVPVLLMIVYYFIYMLLQINIYLVTFIFIVLLLVYYYGLYLNIDPKIRAEILNNILPKK